MSDAILNSTIKYKQKVHYSVYVLALFFLLLPFEYPLADLGRGSIVKYVGILVMGVTLIDILRNNFKIVMDYRFCVMSVWLVFAFISGLWAIDEATHSHFFGMYRNNALMFLFITLVPYNKDEADLIKKALIVGVALLFLYMTFVPGAVVHSVMQGRLTLASRSGGELIDQNYLAAIMSMPYAFLMYDILNKKKEKIFLKILKIVFCVTCVYYILMTGSRSGLIALAMITVLSTANGLKRNFVLSVVLMVLLVLMLPFIFELLPEQLMERFTKEAMTGGTDESGSRLIIWKAALNSINGAEFFIGSGAGTSMAVMEKAMFKRFAIHNYFIAHVVELGFIGLILFTSLVIFMLRELGKMKKTWICIAFVGIVVESLFLDVLPTKFFWGAMMLLSIYVSSGREEKKQQAAIKAREGEKL